MQAKELAVPGAWLFSPPVFPDARGTFAAPFQSSAFVETLGHPFRLAQANTSVSRRGALRGVHFADVPPGQAKYVQCAAGAFLDVVVDLRVGSPTFGEWDAVELDGDDMSAVYLSEGLGHAFLSLADRTVATYLCSTPYAPAAEHGVHALDPDLALPWGRYVDGDELVMSEKDRTAPTLAGALAAGLLPTAEACRRRHEELRVTAPPPLDR